MGDKEEALALLAVPETSVDATPFQKLRAAIFLKKLGEIERAKALVTSRSNPLLKALEGLVLGQSIDPQGLLRQWDEMQSEAMDYCQLVHVAEAAYILDANAKSEELLRGIFAKDSACLRAISVLGDNLLVQNRKDAAIALVQPLIDKHPEQSEFKMLLAQYYRLDGRLDEAVALYEEVVESGNARDEHVRLLVTMYLQQRAEKRQIERWKGLYEENPENKVAALMIGIMLHYRDEFTESQEWLLPLEEQFKGNPRYQIYRAMNDFNLGDKPGCRARLDMAAKLPVIDPDVFYCRGEILRDSERDTAIADFKRYLALTNDSPFNLPEKQARVREQVRLLEECKENGTKTCEGPWEHPRGGLMRFFTLHPEAPWVGFGLLIFLLGSAGFLVHRRRKKKVS
jgi:tetratricopeptide (TPR) repeat protein